MSWISKTAFWARERFLLRMLEETSLKLDLFNTSGTVFPLPAKYWLDKLNNVPLELGGDGL